jgi:hypothetical protein
MLSPGIPRPHGAPARTFADRQDDWLTMTTERRKPARLRRVCSAKPHDALHLSATPERGGFVRLIVIWGGMSSNVAFLTRLFCIVGEAAPDEARAADALALVDAYTHRLYGRLGIAASRRPTTQAKECAKDAFDDLRHSLLNAELGASAGTARIFAAARHRIEMARRALAIRLADDEGADGHGSNEHTACDDDRQLIETMRRRLRDERAIVASQDAIRQSRKLLARFRTTS